jgi:putative membrane protein
MFVTVTMAIGIISTEPGVMKSWWLHAKLALVALLLVYHFYCGNIMKKLAAGTCAWSGQQFRALNEAPTLLLVTIVMLAVFKNSLPLNWTGGLILALIVFMAAAIQLYAKKRRNDQAKLRAAQTQVATELVSNP